MLFFFWFCVFFILFYFSLFFSRILRRFFYLNNLKQTSYVVITFLNFFLCFTVYYHVGGSGLISFYYKEEMLSARHQQGNLRIILNKFNKQLYKLKYSVVKEPMLSRNWYNLGKLYEVQQNNAQAMSSFYKAYKLDTSVNIYLTSYIMNRFIITKGNILDYDSFHYIDTLLQVEPSDIVLLSVLNIDYLLNNFTV